MPQPTGITLGANLGLALAPGDTVHLMIARAQIPVGAATKEANAPTVFVALEGPALIELDGTSACRINLVAGEYSCFFPVVCGVHGHLFELFRHLPQHGRLGIVRVVAANPFLRLRLGALEISHHILGLGFPALDENLFFAHLQNVLRQIFETSRRFEFRNPGVKTPGSVGSELLLSLFPVGCQFFELLGAVADVHRGGGLLLIFHNVIGKDDFLNYFHRSAILTRSAPEQVCAGRSPVGLGP